MCYVEMAPRPLTRTIVIFHQHIIDTSWRMAEGHVGLQLFYV